MNEYDSARMLDLRERRPETEEDWEIAGTRILVVDDDPGICHSLKEILEADGCSVETACDGAEGLRLIESAEFDLVLSDVVMPSMDGYELFKAVRESKPDLPVLIDRAVLEDVVDEQFSVGIPQAEADVIPHGVHHGSQ